MSPLGETGGRSRGNRVGQGASRRNTPRERSYVDPVRDGIETEDLHVGEPLENGLLALAGWTALVALVSVWIVFLVWVGVQLAT